MIITWLGHSSFKIQTQNAVILTDPYDSSIGLRMPKVNADLVLITHDHADHNNMEILTGTPFIVNSPGEYEVRGVFAHGVQAFHDEKNGAERGAITIYRIEADDMKLGFLGDLGQKKLNDEQFENMNGLDIIFIPVGGNYTIDGKAAAELITELEPRIVIPMHYKIPGLSAKVSITGVEPFMKQMGITSNGKEDRLKISKKDLPQEDTRVVILRPAV
ncbi:MAG: MBL fold metallo-hydrolase [Patescibacteria group bacterium]|jgi:L-ascorbate metabolism protein UlaG (beta-lactamase superfamily)